MARRTKSKKFDNRMNEAVVGGTGSETTVPELGRDILTKLQQKIQSGLVKVQGGRNDISGLKVDKKNDNKMRHGTFSEKKLESISAYTRYPDLDTTPNSAPDIIHGKKRKREGIIKQQQLTQLEISRRNGNSAKSSLFKEILDLGGTQEDFDLVKDIESDNETMVVRATGPDGKGLKADLKRLMGEMEYDVAKFTTQHVVADEGLSEDGSEESYDGAEARHSDSTKKDCGEASIQGMDSKPQMKETLSTSINLNEGELVCSSLFQYSNLYAD